MSSMGEGRDEQRFACELVSLLVIELLLFDISRAKGSLDVGSVGVTHMGVAFLGSQSTTVLCLLMKSIPTMTSYEGDKGRTMKSSTNDMSPSTKGVA